MKRTRKLQGKRRDVMLARLNSIMESLPKNPKNRALGREALELLNALTPADERSKVIP
jgi:hypothetical protein